MANDFSGGIVHLKHILHASDGAHPVNYVDFVGYQRAFKCPPSLRVYAIDAYASRGYSRLQD
jgi:hypothetical protein